MLCEICQQIFTEKDNAAKLYGRPHHHIIEDLHKAVVAE
jgi:hypothetical protein